MYIIEVELVIKIYFLIILFLMLGAPSISPFRLCHGPALIMILYIVYVVHIYYVFVFLVSHSVLDKCMAFSL